MAAVDTAHQTAGEGMVVEVHKPGREVPEVEQSQVVVLPEHHLLYQREKTQREG